MSLLITCDGGGWKTPMRLRSRLEDTELLAASCLVDSIAGSIDDGPLACGGIDREANFAARRLGHRSGGIVIATSTEAI